MVVTPQTLVQLPSTFTLCRVHLLDRPGLFDVHVQDGFIHDVYPTLFSESSHEDQSVHLETWPPQVRADRYDLAGRLLLPGFVDIHVHLDKALTLPFTPSTSGTLVAAIEAFERYHAILTADDVYRRTVSVALMALSHGTTTLRTHINFHDRRYVDEVLAGIQAARDELKGQFDIQVVLMCPLVEHPEVDTLLRERAEAFVAVGGAPHLSPQPEENMNWIVSLAHRHELSVDVHVDETLNPDVRTLDHLARLVKNRDFPSPVVAGHCVSLDAMPEAEAVEIVERVAEAGVGIVTLPGANLYLQGREDRSSVRRGVTRIKLLQQKGVLVAAASDNIQDVFHPYGRGDLIDAALLAAYCGHFLPSDAENALKMISLVPGRLAVHPKYGIRVGNEADMVVLDASDPLSVLQSLTPNRWVFKRGKLVAGQWGGSWLSEQLPFTLTAFVDVQFSGESFRLV
ncbi:amidohydrolase [Alicyclobacillus cellulosilyticus]|uniref:Amidohydrolase n=1 Tax=Alicyclobacillus cellulosilyticus TaxID=1003997 RepID=A0A917NN63_9BACL|nr:amidohydrolase family protein [Alicyclobacillus cellulosilyticus]GGJ12722.1 amidohydrolase [Alicyclobacillus cellulosilyticus]